MGESRPKSDEKPIGNPFYEVVRGLLRERLELVKAKKTPEYTDIRHLYYQAKKIYKDLTDEDDVPGAYNNYIGAVNKFCQKHAHEIGVPEAFWWLLRDKMNIWAKPMAICDGESGRFLIDYDNRERVQKHSSFILLCEKDTVSRQLLEELRKIGYKVNLVSSQGQNVADTKAAIISAVDGLEKENFFILYLHDYDVAGAEMFFDLYSYYPKVIDIGVNEHFLKAMKISRKKVEERVKVKTQRRKLAGYVTEYCYSEIVDLDYICGKLDPRTGKRSGVAKLIEIDNVHVYYGIKPFIDYIKLRLDDIDCWDLSRIGVKKFELEEPSNHYEQVVSDLEDTVGRAYGKKLFELSENLNIVLGIVEDTLTLDPAYTKLEDKYRGEKGQKWNVREGGEHVYSYYEAEVKSERLDEIQDQYEEQIDREWKPDYDDELGEVNELIECYPGDVVKGKEDLKGQVKEIQDKLDKAKEEDPDLDEFETALEDVEWGEEELGEIELMEEEEAIKMVIEALEARLEGIQ